MSEENTSTDTLPSSSTSTSQSQHTSTSASAVPEDVVAKYKRLLSMARSSLETNQASLQLKDQQLTQLMTALEEERNKRISLSNQLTQLTAKYKEKENELLSLSSSSSSSSSTLTDHNSLLNNLPRKILARVDIENAVWLFIEYESPNLNDEWVKFNDEITVKDFIKKIPGPPLILPTRCLNSEESTLLIEENKKKIDKLQEEFRRYKIKTEILLKQKNVNESINSINLWGPSSLAPSLPSPISSSTSSSNVSSVSASGSSLSLSAPNSSSSLNQDDSSLLSPSLQRAMNLGTSSTSTTTSSSTSKEYKKLEQDYEKLLKSYNKLLEEGAENSLTLQWKQRYENCLKEKELAQQKLKLFLQVNDRIGEGEKIEEIYLELQEDYKSLRKRLFHIVQSYKNKEKNSSSSFISASPSTFTSSSERERDIANKENLLDDIERVLHLYQVDSSDLDDSRLILGQKLVQNTKKNDSLSSTSSSSTSTSSLSMTEGKVQYIKQMIFRLLTCKDSEVKSHIQSALITLLRYSEQEKQQIQSCAVSNESGIGLFGSYFSSSTSS